MDTYTVHKVPGTEALSYCTVICGADTVVPGARYRYIPLYSQTPDTPLSPLSALVRERSRQPKPKPSLSFVRVILAGDGALDDPATVSESGELVLAYRGLDRIPGAVAACGEDDAAEPHGERPRHQKVGQFTMLETLSWIRITSKG